MYSIGIGGYGYGYGYGYSYDSVWSVTKEGSRVKMATIVFH